MLILLCCCQDIECAPFVSRTSTDQIQSVERKHSDHRESGENMDTDITTINSASVHGSIATDLVGSSVNLAVDGPQQRHWKELTMVNNDRHLYRLCMAQKEHVSLLFQTYVSNYMMALGAMLQNSAEWQSHLFHHIYIYIYIHIWKPKNVNILLIAVSIMCKRKTM